MLGRLLGSWSLLIGLQTVEISLRSEEESYSANSSRCAWYAVSKAVSSPVGGHACRYEGGKRAISGGIEGRQAGKSEMITVSA